MSITVSGDNGINYIIGRPANTTTYYPGDTVAGSILYMVSPGVRWNGSAWVLFNSATTATAVVQSGTWKCVSLAEYSSGYLSALPGLWVKIA